MIAAKTYGIPLLAPLFYFDPEKPGDGLTSLKYYVLNCNIPIFPKKNKNFRADAFDAINSPEKSRRIEE